MVVLFSPYPFYIKKEDAHLLVKQQKAMMGIVLLGIAIVMGIINFFVTPRLIALYSDFNIPLPPLIQLSPPITYGIIMALLVISYSLLTNRPAYEDINQKLRNYKHGEMIRSSEVVDVKKSLWVLVVVGILVGWLIISIILPIYSLTTTI